MVIPMRDIDAQGTGASLKECQQRFRAAWDSFAPDPAADGILARKTESGCD
jgi:hypothetical protein